MIKKILTILFMITMAGIYALLVAVFTKTGQNFLGIIPFKILVALVAGVLGACLAELYIKINGF